MKKIKAALAISTMLAIFRRLGIYIETGFVAITGHTEGKLTKC